MTNKVAFRGLRLGFIKKFILPFINIRESWIFIGRTDDNAETPVLWPPVAKNWLIWKDPDAGKDWLQEEDNNILCCPLLLLPSILPSIRVFSNESVLRNRWPKYWSFSFSISPSNEYSDWFLLGLTGLISLQSKGLSRVFSSTIIQKHQFFGAQYSLWFSSHICTWLLEKP